MNSPEWFKSSYSENGGQCIEVATNLPGAVPVRDSKDPAGPSLTFTPKSFAAFVRGVKEGSNREGS